MASAFVIGAWRSHRPVAYRLSRLNASSQRLHLLNAAPESKHLRAAQSLASRALATFDLSATVLGSFAWPAVLRRALAPLQIGILIHSLSMPGVLHLTKRHSCQALSGLVARSIASRPRISYY